MRRFASRPRLAWPLAAALAVAACSGVPGGGTIHRAPDLAESESTSTRFVPAGPADGAGPADIVDGYLESMLGFPSDPQITAAFLTDEAAERWRPSARTTVYEVVASSVPEVPEEAQEAAAEIEVRSVAVLDENGRFGYQRSTRTVRLDLMRHDGQWRIDNPPPGLLISERYFEDNVRPAEVFFLDATGDRLIGDPVHVIDDDRAATRLVTALLSGTDDVRAAEVQTFIPEDQTLRGEVEVLDDGVAEVRVRQALAPLDADERERFVAQITATLVQLDSIASVRVVAPDTDVVATSASIGDLRPPTRSTEVFALAGDRLVRLDSAEVEPVEEPWASTEIQAREIAVETDGDRIALIGDDEVEVRAMETAESLVTVSGRSVIAAVWDVDGVLWIVDRAGEGFRVRVVVGEEAAEVDTRAWTMSEVESFDLSPDGARYALLAPSGRGERRILSGAVLRAQDGTVLGVGDPAVIGTPDVEDVASLLWVTDSDLGVAARTNLTGFQPAVIRHDGWRDPTALAERPALPTQTGTRTVMLRPASGDVYVEDDEGVWAITASRPWTLLDEVRAPVRAR